MGAVQTVQVVVAGIGTLELLAAADIAAVCLAYVKAMPLKAALVGAAAITVLAIARITRRTRSTRRTILKTPTPVRTHLIIIRIARIITPAPGTALTGITAGSISAIPGITLIITGT
jgi:multisubunit Na+/H+ antiporter MnhE subunit